MKTNISPELKRVLCNEIKAEAANVIELVMSGGISKEEFRKRHFAIFPVLEKLDMSESDLVKIWQEYCLAAGHSFVNYVVKVNLMLTE